jgi:alpha-galactosidase
MQTLLIENMEIIADCEGAQHHKLGYTIEGANVRVELPETPRCYYRHGWQSWSLAA